MVTTAVTVLQVHNPWHNLQVKRRVEQKVVLSLVLL